MNRPPSLDVDQVANLTKLASLLPNLKLSIQNSTLSDKDKEEKIAKINSELDRINLILVNNRVLDK